MKKTILITGGTTGIGKATALKFAQNNYNVVVTSRDERKKDELKSEFQKLGLEIFFEILDVTNEAQVEQVIRKVVAQFGKLNAIVNNAGISLGNTLLADTEADELKQMLETNVMGVYYGMKYAIKEMLKTGGGAIVNLASIAGINGLMATAQYNASKHAVVGLTKGGALDYATQGIRINAVAPGAIKTDILNNAIESGTYDISSIEALHPMNRIGEVEDIANGIYFLAAEENKFLTGTILNIDGGYNAR